MVADVASVVDRSKILVCCLQPDLVDCQEEALGHYQEDPERHYLWAHSDLVNSFEMVGEKVEEYFAESTASC